MSMSITVVGKFKNGKKRLTGFHSSSNRILLGNDLSGMYNSISKDFKPDIEKFSTVIITANMSPNISRPGVKTYTEELKALTIKDIDTCIKHVVTNMNKLASLWGNVC